jgi:hypothetical protein
VVEPEETLRIFPVLIMDAPQQAAAAAVVVIVPPQALQAV